MKTKINELNNNEMEILTTMVVSSLNELGYNDESDTINALNNNYLNDLEDLIDLDGFHEIINTYEMINTYKKFDY